MPPRGKQPASTSGHRFWVLIGHNLATPQIVIFRVLGDSGARMCTHRVNQQDYHAPVPWETTFRRQRPHYTGLWLSVPSRADAFRYIAFCLANYPALHGLRESGFRPEDAPIYDSLADVPHLIPLLVLQPDYQPRRWWPVLRGLGVNPVAELQRRGMEPAAPDSELEEAAPMLALPPPAAAAALLLAIEAAPPAHQTAEGGGHPAGPAPLWWIITPGPSLRTMLSGPQDWSFGGGIPR